MLDSVGQHKTRPARPCSAGASSRTRNCEPFAPAHASWGRWCGKSEAGGSTAQSRRLLLICCCIGAVYFPPIFILVPRNHKANGAAAPWVFIYMQAATRLRKVDNTRAVFRFETSPCCQLWDLHVRPAPRLRAPGVEGHGAHSPFPPAARAGGLLSIPNRSPATASLAAFSLSDFP